MPCCFLIGSLASDFGGDGCEGGGGGEGGGEDDFTSLHVSTTEKVELQVPAGHTCTWEVRVTAYDCDFTVTLSDGKASKGSNEVSPKQRLKAASGADDGDKGDGGGGGGGGDGGGGGGWVTGSFKSLNEEEETTVCLEFDNSYSWSREKDVQYRYFVLPPSSSDSDGEEEGGGGGGGGEEKA